MAPVEPECLILKQLMMLIQERMYKYSHRYDNKETVLSFKQLPSKNLFSVADASPAEVHQVFLGFIFLIST